MSENIAKSGNRQLRGRVVSDKMANTLVVEVERMAMHAKYRKYVSQIRRYHAHDESGTAKVDDIVLIEECRPLSRSKRWRVLERVAS